MKPLRSLFPLSTWLMRIAVLLFVYISFFQTFTAFNFDTLNFWIAALYVIFAVLLFIGGFLQAHKMTVISSLILSILTLYLLLTNFGSKLDGGDTVYMLLLSVTFFFLCSGNKK